MQDLLDSEGKFSFSFSSEIAVRFTCARWICSSRRCRCLGKTNTELSSYLWLEQLVNYMLIIEMYKDGEPDCDTTASVEFPTWGRCCRAVGACFLLYPSPCLCLASLPVIPSPYAHPLFTTCSCVSVSKMHPLKSPSASSRASPYSFTVHCLYQFFMQVCLRCNLLIFHLGGGG